MSVNPDFKDMLSMFIEEKVEFLLVGAYALSAHGHPRATGDLDLWIHNTEENAARVWRALIAFKGMAATQSLYSDYRFR